MIHLLCFLVAFILSAVGQQRPTAAGTIAYIRDGVEVRLINPDGRK